jgi:hypothetical protein
MERSWSENSTLKRASVLREHGNQYIHHLSEDPEWGYPIGKRCWSGSYTYVVPRRTYAATWPITCLAEEGLGGFR